MSAWWSNDRISATISQEYVERELGSKKRQEDIHRVLAFGDGLTDDTYLDWVLERSPRFFLILNDIGVPEKIFDIIDRSFDDEDLPLSQDALWDLNLFGTRSETLDKKFHRQQFKFLIQDLEPGGHVDFGTWDVVPIDPVVKRAAIPNAQACDKVYAYDRLYTRKKVPTSGDTDVDRIHFIMHLKGLAPIQHKHLVSVFATYAQDEIYYVLFRPSTELTLKQFLEEQPKQFKLLDKKDRREIVLTWAHCMTSALAYLHDNGFAHKAIRPSTVTIRSNTIFLSDYSAMKALDREDAPNTYNSELYDHAPPEDWLRKPCLHETAPLKTILPGGGRTSRRMPKNGAANPNARPPPSPTADSVSRNASKSQSSSASSTNPRPRNAVITTFKPHRASTSSLPKRHYPADVYSLTTVLLTLLSHLLGHSPKSFASHRSRLNRQAGRGNAPPDASFHKNPKQVEKWMDMLAKEAGQKEKKDTKFWGAVVELVGVCRSGICKEPNLRVSAGELEKKVGGWVDWGMGKRRRCQCDAAPQDYDSISAKKADREEVEASSPTSSPRRRTRVLPVKRTSERISYIDRTPARYWTTASEDLSQVFSPTKLMSRSEEADAEGDLEKQSCVSTEVWGLGIALQDGEAVAEEDEEEEEEDEREEPREGEEELEDEEEAQENGIYEYNDDKRNDEYADEDADADADLEEPDGRREDWPLPLGTLTLDHSVL